MVLKVLGQMVPTSPVVRFSRQTTRQNTGLCNEETGKSPYKPTASWRVRGPNILAQSVVKDLRTREAGVVHPPSPSSQKLECKSQSLEAQKPGVLLCKGRRRRGSRSKRERQFLFLCLFIWSKSPPTEWVLPTLWVDLTSSVHQFT